MPNPTTAPNVQLELGEPASQTRQPTNLARILIADIQAGRYAAGAKLPTESELQKRFDASRYAVREALRQLKEQGFIWARAGVGTVVRTGALQKSQMRGEGSLRELVQFAEATRMEVLTRGTWVADAAWAAQFGGQTAQQWATTTVLRRLPGEERPMALLQLYLRPEHASVIDLIDVSGAPVFGLLQHEHGVRIAEVRQQIFAMALDAPTGTLLECAAGTPALNITRHYTDASERIVLLAIGQYPSDRFIHDTRFQALG